MKKFCLFIIYIGLSLSVLQAQQKNWELNPAIANILNEIKDFTDNAFKSDSIKNHPLGSFKEEDFLRSYNFYNALDTKLNLLDSDSLSFDDKINLALLHYIINDELSQYRYKTYLNPILADEGFHTALAARGNTILDSKKDAADYIKVLKDIPRYVDEEIDLMREGLRIGINQPKIIVESFGATYSQHIVDDAEKSVFWKPFVKKPYAINENDWQLLQADAKRAIQQDVISSYKKIKFFFEGEYRDKTRISLGASDMLNGRAFYEDRVKFYTTTNLSSDDIYQTGLKEVARIKNEMDKVLQQVNFKGTFKQFIATLRTDPKFYVTSAEQLLKEASYIAKKSDGMLPSLFGKLPRQPYGVKPVPEYLAPVYTAGRYSGAPVNSKNAGEYWVNTYNLKSRTLYTLEALTLHEAVPGHHLQIALTQESDLPEFRKNLYINAFGEGWGLYAEYLGHEMGFYNDPYSLFGRLTYEMWRACRLVIDVGIHTKGWTREQAVSYLADHTALSLHEVNTEINRYISWPGQALAYKMGEIKIKEMRSKAEDALKENFDVRSFHDMVLSNGTVTLSILEKMTDRYIKEQQEKQKK
ncbi:MAG: hypothetical protein JWN83_2427 [Chitinophagaceae bacterium]|nr:hypothetical protein [Chitinophagaceae bacterium]